MRTAPRAVAARWAKLLLLLAALLPAVAWAQYCPPGTREDPGGNGCVPIGPKKRPPKGEAPPAYGESKDEKERKAKLSRDYCETQCQRAKTDCRPDQSCEEKDRLCRLACFQRFLADLPADRSGAVEAQENLRASVKEAVTEVSRMAEHARQAAQICEAARTGAEHELGADAVRACARASELADTVEGLEPEAQKQQEAFDQAKLRPQVLDAADKLKRLDQRVVSMTRDAQLATDPVLEAAQGWKEALAKVNDAANQADLAATAAERAAARVAELAQRERDAAAQEHQRTAEAAAADARRHATDARQTVELTARQSTVKQTEIPVMAAEKMLEEARAAQGKAEAQVPLEEARHAAIDRRIAEQAAAAQRERDRLTAEEDARQAAIRAAIDQKNRLIAEREAQRAAEGVWRGRGFVALAGAGVALAGTAGFMALGALQNQTILSGGNGAFGSASDIQLAATLGQTYNRAALGLGVTSVLCAAVAAPLILMHPDPGPLRLSLAPQPGGVWVGVGGALP